MTVRGIVPRGSVMPYFCVMRRKRPLRVKFARRRHSRVCMTFL